MKRDYHIKESPIPAGFQIYEERLEVAGVQHRLADGQRFIKGKDYEISLEADPTNPYDSNAVKVLGSSKGLWGRKSRHIGYLPADTAMRVTAFGISDVCPRLLKTYLGKSGYVEVLFQVLGPKGRKKEYLGA